MKISSFILISAVSFYSCTTDDTFQYVELTKEMGTKSDFQEKLPEIIKANSDSDAYVQAYTKFCISKYTKEMFAEGTEIKGDVTVSFRLINSKGQDITTKVAFFKKDSIKTSIDQSIAFSIAELGKGSAKILNEKIIDSTFEILITDHNTTVQNFYIFLKTKNQEKSNLQNIVDKFRDKYCKTNCNIYLYDDKISTSLLKSYPIPDDEYIGLADHFVAESTFEVPEIWMYPYQDLKYKEIGGKNWKKTPLK